MEPKCSISQDNPNAIITVLDYGVTIISDEDVSLLADSLVDASSTSCKETYIDTIQTPNINPPANPPSPLLVFSYFDITNTVCNEFTVTVE
jgi:hypothetical protein